jgi:hypothetical protein
MSTEARLSLHETLAPKRYTLHAKRWSVLLTFAQAAFCPGTWVPGTRLRRKIAPDRGGDEAEDESCGGSTRRSSLLELSKIGFQRCPRET